MENNLINENLDLTKQIDILKNDIKVLNCELKEIELLEFLEENILISEEFTKKLEEDLKNLNKEIQQIRENINLKLKCYVCALRNI